MQLELDAFVSQCTQRAKQRHKVQNKIAKKKPLNVLEQQLLNEEQKARESLEIFRKMLARASMRDRAIVMLEIVAHCRCGAIHRHPNEYLMLESIGKNGELHKEAITNPTEILLNRRDLQRRKEAFHIRLTHCTDCFTCTEDINPAQLSFIFPEYKPCANNDSTPCTAEPAKLALVCP